MIRRRSPSPGAIIPGTSDPRVSPILTPDQRIRVFVSSTLQELASERRAARAAIERLRFTPVMFELGARPHPPQALYRAYLEQSDVFVGIYWQRYGWIAPSMEISGLEDEYRLAADLPKLVYVKGSGEEREPALRELLERVASDHVSYRSFEDEQELANLLADDLALLVSERFTQSTVRIAPLAPLPAPVSSFVGRRSELGDVIQLLQRHDVRLVTLTGPGGIGKTRLALEAARQASSGFGDGVAFVPLAGISDPENVSPAIGEALGVGAEPGASLVDALCARLAQLDLLLVLDNLEQVVSAAPLIGRLLEAAPGLRVLATSRNRLDVRGEHLFHVPPMSLPDESARESEVIRQSDAVRLFALRAESAGWKTSEADVPLLGDIVRRLDGLPLAIELAAAQARLVPAELVHTRLRRRLDLGGGPRDAEERHRTLRSTIAWSYDLLDEPARRFFDTLSVFTGGFSIEAAAAVGDVDGDVEELLASLVDASLVTTDSSRAYGVRFGMLDTIREFAAERLVERGAHQEVTSRHLAYFTQLADDAYEASPEHVVMSHLRQDEERDNLRAAVQEALRTSPVIGVRLAGALEHLWSSRGLAREGREAIARALPAAPDAPARWRARALLAGTWLAAEQGDYLEADRSALEALELFRALGDARYVGETLNALGWAAEGRGDTELAARYFEESYRMFSELPDTSLRVLTVLHFARWLGVKGELGEALRLYGLVLEHFDEMGLDDGRAAVLLNIGEIEERQGNEAAARRSYDASVLLSRRLENKRLLASGLVDLGHVDLRAERTEEAHRSYAEALEIDLDLGDRLGTARCLEGLACVAVARDRWDVTARLLGAARARRDATGVPVPDEEQQVLAEAEAATRAQLGDARFEDAVVSGAALKPPALVALAEDGLAEPSGSRAGV